MIARVHAVCLECGQPFTNPGVGSASDFCCSECRVNWNNRRKLRGAQLYDLYMAHRFDRRAAQALGVFQAINRLASEWRDEDRRNRASRRSFRKPQAVLSERPHLRAAVVFRRSQ